MILKIAHSFPEGRISRFLFCEGGYIIQRHDTDDQKPYWVRRYMNGIAYQRRILNRRKLKASVDDILGEKGYDTNKRLQVVQCLKGALHEGQEEVLAV